MARKCQPYCNNKVKRDNYSENAKQSDRCEYPQKVGLST